jgi:integrase
MSIFKHPQSDYWWIDFTPPGCKRVKRSTGTTDRQAAQELHDKLKAESWRVVQLGEQIERLFDDAALEFLKSSEGQSDYETKVRHVTYFRQYFGGKSLRSLTSEAIRAALPTHSAYTDKRAQRKLAAATVNRYIASITRIMAIAQESDWISTKPKIKLREEGGIRIRYITQAEARGLLASITQDWLRDLVAFALSTGMRQGEILSLKWSSVNLDNRMCWVNPENAKSGHGRAVPLNDEALALITAQVDKHKEFVFTRCGHGMVQIDDKMFKRGCKTAGIEKFRFHDLRHTWASWHAQAGTPLTKLQALGGWLTIQMVMRYAHLSPVHLTEHVSNVLFTAQPALETQKPPARVALSA